MSRALVLAGLYGSARVRGEKEQQDAPASASRARKVKSEIGKFLERQSMGRVSWRACVVAPLLGLAVLGAGCQADPASQPEPAANDQEGPAAVRPGNVANQGDEDTGKPRNRCPTGTKGLDRADLAVQASDGDTGAYVGTVASISHAVASTGSPVFINLGADYPDPDLSIAAFGDSAPDVANWILSELATGDTVCVAGTVRDYAGTPQIIVTSRRHLTLVLRGEQGRTMRQTADLRRLCRAVIEESRRWSTPPNARELQQAELGFDYPRYDEFEPGTPASHAADSLLAYADAVEEASYFLFDPNLPPQEVPYVVSPVLDALRDVRSGCSGLQ